MTNGHSEPIAETPLLRVTFERLEFDDQFALLDGEPFTGVVFSRYSDGALEFERAYRNGLPDGLQQDWYPNGHLFERWIAIRARGSSEAWSWYPDGTRRSYRRYGGDGLPVELGAWDEGGAEIDPKSQPELNGLGVMRELLARAETLKLAARSASYTRKDDPL